MELITKNPLYAIKVKSLSDLGLKPKYIVDRKDEKNKHTYTINGGKTWFVGVSSVLEMCPKPFLIPWAALEGAKRTAMLTKKLRDSFRDILFRPGIFEMDQGKVFQLFERLFSDKRIDRVTQWGKKGYAKIKDTAADVGTRAHAAIDAMIKGEEVVMSPDIEMPVNGFLHWLSITNLTIASGDIKVASIEYEFGGSIDAIFVDKFGHVVVGDFKTSKQFADSYAAQVSGYSKAFSETYDLDRLPPAFIIRFDKFKPEVEIREIAFLNEAWKWFESLLSAYRLSQINFYDDIQKYKYGPSKEKKK